MDDFDNSNKSQVFVDHKPSKSNINNMAGGPRSSSECDMRLHTADNQIFDVPHEVLNANSSTSEALNNADKRATDEIPTGITLSATHGLEGRTLVQPCTHHSDNSTADFNSAGETTGLLQQINRTRNYSAEERAPVLLEPNGNAVQSEVDRSLHVKSYSYSTMNSLKVWLQDISLPVYLLVMCFAIASWIDINGLWVEVPLLVNELPEGWNLPSYLVIIIQIANIGPLTYTIANRVAPNRVKEWPVVYLIIGIGAVSCLLLAFFWDRTSIVGGNEHSTALLSLSACLALVDCTSSVVFLPFMAVFKPQYMSAYYIGEGLSGLLPGLVGLAQGVGGDPICINSSQIVHNETTGENRTEWIITPEYPDPRFSIEVFFFFLFGMICLSGVAFTFLHFAPFCKKETLAWSLDLTKHVPTESGYYKTNSNDSNSSLEDEDHNEAIEISTNKSPPQINVSGVDASNIHLTNQIVAQDRDADGVDFSKPSLSMEQFVYLLVVTAWVNGLTNGVLPSTQSYTGLPYGNRAYSLSVRLGTVANPLACFVALLVPTTSLLAVGILTALGTVCSGYQLYLAAMSPTPPLQGEPLGEFFVIATFVILVGLFSYTKVTIASILQAEGGRKSLLWCGAVTQFGSFIGAIITFILVNILEVFTATYPCS